MKMYILKRIFVGFMLSSIILSAGDLDVNSLKNHKTCNDNGKPTVISFFDMKHYYPTIFKKFNRSGNYRFVKDKGRLILYVEVSDSKHDLKTKLLLKKSPNGNCYYAVRMKGIQKGREYDLRRSDNSKALTQVSNSILLTVNAKNEKGLSRQIQNLNDDF